jgi:DNA-binding IclR family transcriptional regulator
MYSDSCARTALPHLGELERDLGRTRKRGYALSLGDHLAGVRAIGVPVRGGQGRPVAALTAASRSSRWGRAQLIALVPRLQETAEAIALDLREPAP